MKLDIIAKDNWTRGKTALVTDLTDTEVIAAIPGHQVHILNIHVQNADASVSTWVNIRNGGTDVFPIYCPAAGGGATVSLRVPLKGATNSNWSVQAETTSAEIKCTLIGFITAA